MYYYNIIMEVIQIAILFSQVKVQSADQSETFLISGIPKEYDDLTESVQLEWFLQDIDSDDYYRFDEARYEVVGRSSGIRLTLGSRVRIRVKGVDMNRRTLDFKLLL